MAIVLLEHEAIIFADPHSVFKHITKLDNEQSWQADITDLFAVSDRPVGRGFRFVEVRRTLGLKFCWEFEIVSLVPDREIKIASIKGRCPYEGSRRCVPVTNGTKVIEQGQLTLPGVPQFLSPLIVALSQKRIRRAYTCLKAIIECNPGTEFTALK